MDASQTKQLAEDSQDDLILQQMKRIRKVIKDGALQGFFTVMIFETIFKENRDILTDEGYHVARRGGRMGENNYLINWGKGDSPDSTQGDPVYYPASSTPFYPL